MQCFTCFNSFGHHFCQTWWYCTTLFALLQSITADSLCVHKTQPHTFKLCGVQTPIFSVADTLVVQVLWISGVSEYHTQKCLMTNIKSRKVQVERRRGGWKWLMTIGLLTKHSCLCETRRKWSCPFKNKNSVFIYPPWNKWKFGGNFTRHLWSFTAK